MTDYTPGSDDASNGWKRRRNRRRRRLRDRFESSRRRHEPPPDPDQWQPEPTWKHILQTLWDNPMALVLLAIMIAVLLYLLFPPEYSSDLVAGAVDVIAGG